MSENIYDSSFRFDLDKEYLYEQYRYLRRENSPVYGAERPEDVVIVPLSFDELAYSFAAEGTRLYLFGGPWCACTAGVIDYINFYAKKYGVDAVYHFDFRLDGASRDLSIREDLTVQPSYTGPDGAEERFLAAENNYLYGELVNRFLTNLNDWVKGKAGQGGDIVYLDRYEEQTAAPRVSVPFLFLYNKDNTVDNSGAGGKSESGKYPILWALEKEYYRDENDGKLYTDGEIHDGTTLAPDYGPELEAAIFRHIAENPITPYTHADYIRDVYRRNERGHAFKTQDAFSETEKINIRMINFGEFQWILRQKGTFLLLIGGAWCANTQAAVATINDYAVANDVQVYMFDTRLDGKYAIDFWYYPRRRDFQIRSNTSPYKRYFVDLAETYLPDLTSQWKRGFRDGPIIEYTDENGVLHQAGRIQAPYLLAYNGEGYDEREGVQRVLAYCERMYELINTNRKLFIYREPNYKDYKAGVYRVFWAYADALGLEAKEISADRTAPVVEGRPVKHLEVPPYPERPEELGPRRVLRGI